MKFRKPLVKYRRGRWVITDPACRGGSGHVRPCFCSSVPHLFAAQRYAQLVAVASGAGLS